MRGGKVCPGGSVFPFWELHLQVLPLRTAFKSLTMVFASNSTRKKG